MKVRVYTPTNQYLDYNDYRDFLEIKINDKDGLGFYDGEPEDNNISRNFSDVHAIANYLKDAFNAGKNGEEFDIEFIEVDNSDEIE